jgi:hypothetical protein
LSSNIKVKINPPSTSRLYGQTMRLAKEEVKPATAFVKRRPKVAERINEYRYFYCFIY